MSDLPSGFQISRRQLLSTFGVIAAPFVIRRAELLMPVNNHSRPLRRPIESLWSRDLTMHPPTLLEVKAWQNSLIDMGFHFGWNPEGMTRIVAIADAEKRYQEMGLL